jgi:hypothetical protein
VRAVFGLTVTQKLPEPPLHGGNREAAVTSRCPPQRLGCGEPLADVAKLVVAIARAIAKQDHEQETGSRLPNEDESLAGRGSKGGS